MWRAFLSRQLELWVVFVCAGFAHLDIHPLSKLCCVWTVSEQQFSSLTADSWLDWGLVSGQYLLLFWTHSCLALGLFPCWKIKHLTQFFCRLQQRFLFLYFVALTFPFTSFSERATKQHPHSVREAATSRPDPRESASRVWGVFLYFSLHQIVQCYFYYIIKVSLSQLVSKQMNCSIVIQFNKIKKSKGGGYFYRHCNMCHVLRWYQMLLSNHPRVWEKSRQLDAHRVIRCVHFCGRSILFLHFSLEMLSPVGA